VAFVKARLPDTLLGARAGKRLLGPFSMPNRSVWFNVTPDLPEEGGCDLRVLITGGGGFIGTHLAHLFTASGARVAILDRHAPQGVEMCGQSIRYIRGEFRRRRGSGCALDSVDVVYHLAWSGIHSVSNQDVSGMPL